MATILVLKISISFPYFTQCQRIESKKKESFEFVPSRPVPHACHYAGSNQSFPILPFFLSVNCLKDGVGACCSAK